MNQERMLQILLSPHESEKATLADEQFNQVVFKVVRNASKLEIRRAVEQLFSVSVIAVRTVNVKGKVKRSGARFGRRSSWKKAIISLAPGNEIDIANNGG